ncbi:hypothetical protein ACVWV7_001014 [Aeromonas hydrophila]
MNNVDMERAGRIRKAIVDSSTYEKTESATGINITTLKRIASGKRDVYTKELEAIAAVTKTDVEYLMFGERMEILFKPRNGTAEQALHSLSKNINRLSDDEIIFLSKMISGL